VVVTGVSVGGGGEQGHSTESAKNPAGGRRAGLDRALQALQPSHPRTGPDEPALADRHGAPFGWVQPPVMFAEPWAGHRAGAEDKLRPKARFSQTRIARRRNLARVRVFEPVL
jgi:hypothetical protein